jgi:class 3 adenylate cyclase
LRGIVKNYHEWAADTIDRFSASIGGYVGTTVLAHFGYPAAHEDDAEQAVLAGLRLCTAVENLASNENVQLRCRVGIATGLVIAGEPAQMGGVGAGAVVGEAPSVAQRLQALGQPGTVTIDGTTRRLIGNLFQCRDLATVYAEIDEAFQVLGPSKIESRFEALRTTDLTELVGREEETELLLRRWHRARGGEGQVVLISGEAGIGKSRLTAAVLERLASEHQTLRYSSSPRHTDSALYPVADQLERAAGFTHQDDPRVKLDKLDAVLARTSTSDADAALFAELLSLPNDGRYPVLALAPTLRRQRMLKALTSHLAALAGLQPALMVFEDAHWADPTSLEWLSRTIEFIHSIPVLLIVTFRSEFVAPWVGQAHVTSLTLNRLGEREVAVMIGGLAGNRQLPASVMAQIVARTDGIPLFVEEMTKAVLEAKSEGEAPRTVGVGPAPALAVPASLQASLMARLDRLGPAREIAQVGAAIGREFSYELLAFVTPRTEVETRHALDQLVAVGLMFQRGSPPASDYKFKHALVQDAAYNTLLRGPRQALHGRLAAALQERFPDTADSQPQLLAQHFTEAGLTEQAVAYWEKAGQRSLSRPAMAEAAVQLRNALDLLMKLPHSEERDRKELDLLVALGSALGGAKGYGGDELHRTNARARELSTRGDTRHLIAVFQGSFMSQLGRSVPAAPRIGEELLRLARERSDTTAQMMAHRMLGIGFWHLGRPTSCRAHLEQAVALYDPTRNRSMQSDIAEARGHCLEYLSLVLVPLGYSEQSNLRYQDARTETEQLIAANPRAMRVSAGYFNCCVTQHMRRDVDRTGECADLLVEFAKQNGLGPWASAGKIWQGWVRFGRGEVGGALAQMREGLAEYRAAGTPHVLYYFIMLLADVEARLGVRQEGLAHQAEASMLQDSLGAGGFACDLLRIKGELLALSEDSTDAEACFRHSIALAREQEAPMWELRAAVGLGRLWVAHGRRTEICNLVAPIYSRFTEGFDTPDLIDAKVLLNETA